MTYSGNRLHGQTGLYSGEYRPNRATLARLLLLVVWMSAVACHLESSDNKSLRIDFSQRTGADTWRKTMQENMSRELSGSGTETTDYS